MNLDDRIKQIKDLPRILPEDRPQRCAGCPSQSLCIGPRGPADSPFVIVGESPGSNELFKGYPFVGDSGEMLTSVLHEAGLYDAGYEPFIVNALSCLPKEKTIPTMAPMVQSCQNRLYEELAAHPRKVILCLGAAASWSLTNNFGLKITLDRGRLYEHPLAEIGVVTAVHPAFLMRSGSGFPQWKKDVTYAVNLLLGEETPERWTPPLWSIVQTREELQNLVTKFRKAEEITGDIETGGKDGTGLDFQRGYVLSLGVTSDLSGGRHVDIIPGDIIWANEDLMQELLGMPQAKWIWQNGKFDIKFFRYEGLTNARVDEDTMLLSYAMNENKGHDLDSIAWDWIRAPKHKDVVDHWFKQNGIAKKNWDYSLLPKDLLYKYQAYDISKTHQMFYPLREAVAADPNLEKLYTEQLIPASEFLANIELVGLTLDPERVEENKTVLAMRMQEIEEKIQPYAERYLGHRINLGSPQQLQRLLYGRMKLGPPGSSTDEDSLIKIQRQHDHPIAGLLLQWRKVAKQRNTYVKPALDRMEPVSSSSKKLVFKRGWVGLDGRVHCSFKLHGTTTGRLASSDPNMQNIPRDPTIRGQFVAAPGKVLIEVDLNQAELRVLALMSGDPTLLKIYRENTTSIHHITSVAMFGERYDDDQKMRAKAVNFGIVYGREPPSLAEEFNISVAEAAEYIKIWLATYPVARDFMLRLREYPIAQRSMINAFGRKKRWGLISPDNLHSMQNEAANWPMQSTAHDITLRAGIIVQPVLKKRWDIDIVNEIHDALYLEAENDPEIILPATKYVQETMMAVPKMVGLTKVPFLAEAKMGTRWGRDYMSDELFTGKSKSK